MMQTSAATGLHTSFTGELIRRQHKAGQQYVQLVFKHGKHSKLALTGDMAMARSLRVGHTYKVGGREFVMGNKTYVRDPRTLPVSASKRSKKLVISGAAGAACMLLVGGFLTMQVWAHSRHAQLTTDASQQNQVNGVSNNTQSPSTPASAASTPTTDSPAATAGTGTTTTYRRSSGSTSSSSSNSNSSNGGSSSNETPSNPGTDNPVTEPPVTEPPVTEPPVTEPPVTEPPVTEPPVTEPPAGE